MVGNKMAISGRTKYQIIAHICIEKTSSCNTENIYKLCTESQYLCNLKRNILLFKLIWKDLIHQISVLIYFSIHLGLVGKGLCTTNCLK